MNPKRKPRGLDASSDVDSEHEMAFAEARRLCTEYSPYELAPMVGAFYLFNTTPIRYPPKHLAVKFVLEHGDSDSGRRPSPQTTLKVLELFSKARRTMIPGEKEFFEFTIDAVSETSAFESSGFRTKTMRTASSLITNSGTVGQNICYAVKRFEPFKADIEKVMGFRLIPAVKAEIFLWDWMDRILVAEAPDTTKSIANAITAAGGPIATCGKMSIPPKRFLEANRHAVNIDISDLRQHYRDHGADFSIISNMSSDIRHFCDNRLFMARWYGLRLGEDRYLLPLPESIISTSITSIRLQLSESLGDSKGGEYANKAGREFERLVVRLLKKECPDARVKSCIGVEDASGHRIGDIDVLLDIGDDKSLLIECKARRFRPIGRWSDDRYVVSDFKRSVTDAFQQIHRVLQVRPDIARGVLAAIVINEEYIPDSDSLLRALSSDYPFISQLPSPMVMGYCDFEYLLRRIPLDCMQRYINWREKEVVRRLLQTSDESDRVYAFLEYPHLFWNLSMDDKKMIVIQFHDTEFMRETKLAAHEMLGLPPSVLIS